MGISSGLGGYTPPGLVLVKSQTIGSAVSSVTVTDVFSANWETYRVVISNVTTSSSGSGTSIWFKMHDGTNPASTNYNYGFTRIDIAATTVAGVTASLGTNGILVGRGTGDKFGNSFDVVNPYISTHTIFPHVSAANVSTGYMYTGVGMHQTTASYTSFQLIIDTGTMTGGTIRVYGYRN